MARLPGTRNAAAAPCRPLAAMRAPALGASPHKSDASDESDQTSDEDATETDDVTQASAE